MGSIKCVTVFRYVLQLDPIRRKDTVKGQSASVQEDKYLKASSLRNKCLSTPELAASISTTYA